MFDVSDALRTIRVEKLLRETKTVLKPPRTLKRVQWPPNYDEVWVWRKSQLAKFELNPTLVVDAKAFYAKHPVEFINHWCDTSDPRNAGSDRPVWMSFVLFERQEELVKFIMSCINDEEPGLVEKSRDMGATWICVALSVWMWLFWPGTAIGWGSQNAVSVDRIGDPKSIFFKIRGLIERLPTVFKPNLGPDHLKQYACINPDNGSTIVGEVGDNIGRGGRTRVYFLDESAHYEHPEVIQASLSDNTRVTIDISSVNGLGNVFHRRREAGQDWAPGLKMEPGRTRIFVLDWRDHPEKSEEWYKRRKRKAEDDGLLHVLAQEVDRDYSAAVEGRIIPSEWLDACVDAHLYLGFSDDGGSVAGLDVADGGHDTNAFVRRKGVVLNYAEEWGERDPGVTARRAIAGCMDHTPIDLEYDSIGVGAAVKAEANRLKLDDEETAKLLRKINLVPWNAGAAVLNPRQRVVKFDDGQEDDQSPRNEDFYHNLKAQGWWELRMRCYRTYRLVVLKRKAVEAGEEWNEAFDSSELISFSSKLKLLHRIKKELAQPTASKSSKMKMLVDKTPDGTKSPNLGDAVMMCYWPLPIKSGLTLLGHGPKVFVEGEEYRGGRR